MVYFELDYTLTETRITFSEFLPTTLDIISSASDFTTTYENQHTGGTDASSEPHTSSTNTSPDAYTSTKKSLCMKFIMTTIFVLSVG